MKTRDLTRTAIFTALTCVAAIIFRYVPQTLVPYSILPLMVLLAGFLLGPKLGAWSMALYALIGVIGLPVFASAPYGGIAYVMKPTFGFILGYVPAAIGVGTVLRIKKDAGPVLGTILAALAVLVGLFFIYLVGLSYFYLIINFVMHKTMAVSGVIKQAFLPFIALDLAKGVVVVILARLLKSRLALEQAAAN